MAGEQKKYFIGVDGGGSKTAAAIVSSEQKANAKPGEAIEPLATAKSGSTNSNSVGVETARKNLLEAINGVISQQQCALNEVGCICCCMSGVDRPSDITMVTKWLEEDLNAKENNITIRIHNDAVGALSSGTLGRLCGVVVISGTGMISVGYNAKGETTRSGGWGPLLGDNGSGWAIGWDTLRGVARAVDQRGPETSLVQEVLKLLGLEKPQDLIPWAYSDLSWSRIAAITPVCFQEAAKGDAVAKQIIARNVEELALTVESVVRKLNLSSEEEMVLVMCGGNLTHEGSLLAKELTERIHKTLPQIKITLPKVEPVVGAALLAMYANDQQQ
eukprot:GEZU01001041.1.p1 GENE.GEZU01001041.1~~GEZU01001041.1.p1  ORF type:complete len:362 (-),score=97.82 GEZU01001041.1:20-1012(-)